jgi:hypothetical protein
MTLKSQDDVDEDVLVLVAMEHDGRRLVRRGDLL